MIHKSKIFFNNAYLPGSVNNYQIIFPFKVRYIIFYYMINSENQIILDDKYDDNQIYFPGKVYILPFDCTKISLIENTSNISVSTGHIIASDSYQEIINYQNLSQLVTNRSLGEESDYYGGVYTSPILAQINFLLYEKTRVKISNFLSSTLVPVLIKQNPIGYALSDSTKKLFCNTAIQDLFAEIIIPETGLYRLATLVISTGLISDPPPAGQLTIGL